MSRACSSHATGPTIAEMTTENEQMFDTAGMNVDPITEFDPATEIDNLSEKIAKGVDWDDQVAAMRRLMGLVRGGILEDESFVRQLSVLYQGLADAACNLRSALVKQSCLVISQLARELGATFDIVGDFFPPLSTQLSHGTQIIAESCKFTLLVIARNCQTRRTILAILELAGKKGVAQRSVAAESLQIVMRDWEFAKVEKSWSNIEPVLMNLLNDAASEVRMFARMAVKHLQAPAPKYYQAILAKVDEKLRQAIEEQTVQSVEKPAVKLLRTLKKRLRHAKTFETRPKTTQDPEVSEADRRLKELELKRKELLQQFKNRPKDIEQKPAANQAPEVREEARELREFEIKQREQRENFKNRAKESRPKTQVAENPEKKQREFEVKYKKQLQEARNKAKSKPQSAREPARQMQEYVMAGPQVRPSEDAKIGTQKRSKAVQKEAQPSPRDVVQPVAKERVSKIPGIRRMKSVQSEFVSKDDPQPPRALLRGNKSNSDLSKLEPKIAIPKVGSNREHSAVTNRVNKVISKPRRKTNDLPELYKPIRFEPGKEQSFLAEVSDLIRQGKIRSLEPDIPQVALGTLKCCLSPSQQISGPAFRILKEILPQYSSCFLNTLPKIVVLLLKSTGTNAGIAKEILCDMTRIFDCNVLLSVAICQPPSTLLLHFLTALLARPDIQLTDDAICINIMNIAIAFRKSGDLKERHECVAIVKKIDQVNHSIVAERWGVVEAIKPRPDPTQAPERDASLPTFSVPGFKQFKADMTDVIANTTRQQWPNITRQVWKELGKGLASPKLQREVLRIVEAAIETHGTLEIHRIFSQILQCDGSEDLIAYLVAHGSVRDLYQALQVDLATSATAVLFLQMIFRQRKDADVLKALPTIMSQLQKALEDGDADLRQAAVTCFALLKKNFGDAANPFIEKLAPAQQKLISIYCKRTDL